ncbi:hypothetical protein COCC4DRAFT_134215 [Bipolaris maydis ATCC 48331]|uniref:MAPEG family protein n=3 Tax=Cochliobolus heterostrophus TaxID=5016 RepID=M2UHB7_COCH5|nr:uncharacterized protein COCC4DRAFT_134215 [Bipolaris maydis ATCC 48331]EMD87363.1 hypothetical protein COCHEDRAFT_1159652 [Bipolaris maydis C5]ENI06561.1 hypothetical protein COCC4DRAFT_134215 [Bipolaris maydis ATCC 48331]KAJ6212231.1 hypothetical protein PSV09DRAFT_1159652 [Bipolaris maydis]
MADDKKEQAKQAAADNGILNPSGVMVMAAAPMYIALVPVTTYLTAPESICQSLVHAIIKLLPGINTTGITSGRAIPALSTLYLFWTFGASGALSAAGQAMGRREGMDNNHPRKHVHQLEGLPLRLRSAHYALLENFPAFALAAALAQIMAPNDAQIVNLLGFHVMAKLMVHYPAYVGNLAVPRSFAHLSATAALVNVCWRLAGAS